MRSDARKRLAGATEAHMHPAVAAMIEGALRRHPEDCGQRHILGRPECQAYDEALVVLGLGTS